MKNTTILTIVLFAVLLSGCLNSPAQETAAQSEAMSEQIQTEQTEETTLTMGYTGTIYTNEVNGATIHSYVGYTADVSNLIEIDEGLILMDPQPTYSASEELNNYMETLDKPLVHVLVPSHGLGLASYEGIPVSASRQMGSFMESGGAEVFIDIFKGAFGDDLDERLSSIDNYLEEGSNTVDGVSFIMTTHENDFPPVSDLEFTDYNVLLTHLSANETHMLVNNREQISDLKDYWTQARASNYELILSAHLKPVDARAIDFQLTYLDVLENASQNENKEEFMQTMQTAYPDAGMPQFLAMTANNFYGQ